MESNWFVVGTCWIVIFLFHLSFHMKYITSKVWFVGYSNVIFICTVIIQSDIMKNRPFQQHCVLVCSSQSHVFVFRRIESFFFTLTNFPSGIPLIDAFPSRRSATRVSSYQYERYQFQLAADLNINDTYQLLMLSNQGRLIGYWVVFVICTAFFGLDPVYRRRAKKANLSIVP